MTHPQACSLRRVPDSGIAHLCLLSSAKGPLQHVIQCCELIPCPTMVADWPCPGVLFLRHHPCPSWLACPFTTQRNRHPRLGRPGGPCSAQAVWPPSPCPRIQRQAGAGLRASECRGFQAGEGLAQASRCPPVFPSSQLRSRAAVIICRGFSCGHGEASLSQSLRYLGSEQCIRKDVADPSFVPLFLTRDGLGRWPQTEPWVLILAS